MAGDNEKTCPECGRSFEPRRSDQVYCSEPCRRARYARDPKRRKAAYDAAVRYRHENAEGISRAWGHTRSGRRILLDRACVELVKEGLCDRSCGDSETSWCPACTARASEKGSDGK